MVKCAKKLINPLTKWANMQKRVSSSRRQSFGSYICAYYVIFQFPHAYMYTFLPDKLQKITKHFQCGYKTKTRLKHRTHYAIFQNRRICADRQTIWLGALCGLCIFALYINGLRSALVGQYSLLGCFIQSWFALAFRA